MSCNENTAVTLPDVANEAITAVEGRLDWVGMKNIDMPVLIEDVAGHQIQTPGRITAYVNLPRPEARGIHMSRLYLHVDRVLGTEVISPAALRQMLSSFLESHSDLSTAAMAEVCFDLMVQREALRSANSGWMRYPVVVSGIMRGRELALELEVRVSYSSTCPCSAALARQLIQQRFAKDFDHSQALRHDEIMAWLGSEQGICATPHSQRSEARVRVRLAANFGCFGALDLINRVEAALTTPVQAVVKREDEQAFALLNGQNLMFCEDAARRIQATLNADDAIADFRAQCSHFESLHPHDAVSIVTKGVDGGYRD